MDIVTKIKPLKASYDSMSLFSKIIIVFTLISLINIVFPVETMAFETSIPVPASMIFEVGDYQDHVTQINFSVQKQYTHEQTVAMLRRQIHFQETLKNYLRSQGSPLAEYTGIILEQNNWKKIIALSNAESSMCRRYPEQLANCWGVGGSNLWDMGDNLGEGIKAMNNFLNNAPSKSRIKYSQMNFEQMNGLYKQPPGDHWVQNNLVVYNQLSELERSVR